MQVDVDESFFNDPRARRGARLMDWHIDFFAGAIERLWLLALHRVGPDNPHGLVAIEDAEDATDHRGLVRACMTAKLAIEQPDGRLYFAGTDERSTRLYHLRVNSKAGGEARAKGAARIGGRFAPATPPAPPAIDQPTAGETPASHQPKVDQQPAPFPSLPLPSGIPGHPPSLRSGGAPSAPPPETAQDKPTSARALPLDPNPPEPTTGQAGAFRAKRRPRAVPDTDWHRAIDMFDQLFRAWAGEPPRWLERERGQMKQLLEAGATVEQISERANVMFDLAPRFPAEHPDMGTLLANWDKFVKPVTNGRSGQGSIATAAELGPAREEPF